MVTERCPETSSRSNSIRWTEVPDNLPVYPLVSLEPCDEIFVVQPCPSEEATAGIPELGHDIGYLQHRQLAGAPPRVARPLRPPALYGRRRKSGGSS